MKADRKRYSETNQPYLQKLEQQQAMLKHFEQFNKEAFSADAAEELMRKALDSVREIDEAQCDGLASSYHMLEEMDKYLDSKPGLGNTGKKDILGRLKLILADEDLEASGKFERVVDYCTDERVNCLKQGADGRLWNMFASFLNKVISFLTGGNVTNYVKSTYEHREKVDAFKEQSQLKLSNNHHGFFAEHSASTTPLSTVEEEEQLITPHTHLL